MSEITRREFMKMGAYFAAVLGLEASAIPKVAAAIQSIASTNTPVLWLQGQNCTGCSISMLNTEVPGIAQVVTEYISLKFHSNISAATGHTAMEVINGCIDSGDYILAVEGSIPADMPQACVIDHEYFGDQIVRAARNATAVVTVGTCASFGGIPSAQNNPTGAVDVPTYLKDKRVSKPIISLPGCPIHPDWIIGTIIHVLKFGLPELDEQHRPKMFYSKLVHDQCQRFADYEREHFAKNFSDDGCLFKLGCLGTKTHADCPTRLWNSGTNNCINSGAPCVGCAWEGFAKKRDFPFYRTGENQNQIKPLVD